MSAVDRSKLNALLPNLSVGQVADPELRQAVFEEIYNFLEQRALEADVLLKTNTTVYTPAADYHPATRKFTEEAINAAISGVVGTPIVQTGAQFPSTPASGQTFFYTVDNRLNVFASSQWNASATVKELLNNQRALSMGGMV